MVQLKKQLYLLKIILFIGLGLSLLIFDNFSVMAMQNNYKHQLKKDAELVDKAIDDLYEGINFFDKKNIKINLNHITQKINKSLFKTNKKTEYTAEYDTLIDRQSSAKKQKR
ncbi:MAG: SVM family protein [Vigna little leaf phytoplasma]|nr:SVM family protein [Vigna little leaf phytoplasma]